MPQLLFRPPHPALSVTLFLALTLLHALFGYYFWGQHSFSLGNDDAYITFRYAANLVDHGVVSYNPGDDPPVEGYSNPLFMLLAALAYAGVGKDALYPVMAGVGVLCMLGTLLAVTRHLNHGEAALAPWVLMTLALVPGLWINATSGLETAAVLLCQVGVWLGTLRVAADGPDGRRGGGLGLLLLSSVLLVLLRIDGFVFPLAAGAYLLLRGQARPAAFVVAASAAAFLALMAVRLAYYGLPMPLTFYNKVSLGALDRLVVPLREMAGMTLKSGFLIPVLGLLAAAGTWLLGRGAVLRRLPFELFGALWVIAYFIAIGGDIYRERFLLIVIVMGTVLFWRGPAATVGLARAPLVLAVAAAYLLSGFWTDPRLELIVERPKYDRVVTLGRFLAQRHPDAVLATSTAGKLPYFSSLHTIDMLGLNDRHIAMSESSNVTPGHGKFDPDYVLAMRPDVICSHLLPDGSLTYGIDRARYGAEGYRLAYLLRSRGRGGPPILQVTNPSDAFVARSHAAGYFYACVIRP